MSKFKPLILILANTFFLILILELIFKAKDFFSLNYFDNKKNIISYYTDYKSHDFLGYTARKNSSGNDIHYVPNKFFKTTTNSDGFRTKKFYPKKKDKLRIILIGDSFVFGQNAHDNETIAHQLENKLKRNYSNHIEVFSLGIIGYSGLNYAGVARTYFDYLKPDIIILCIDQSDFQDDQSKNKLYKYRFDENGYPLFIEKFPKSDNISIDNQRNIILVKNNKDTLIHKIKLESSLFTRINKIRHYLKQRKIELEFKNLLKKKYDVINYNELSKSQKNDLSNIVKSGDILPYSVERSFKSYQLTIKSIEYVVKKANEIESDIYFSTYPYGWFVDKENSKYYQLKNFNKIINFSSNNVFPELVDKISNNLKVEHLNSYQYFKDLNGKYWGDYDPHFNKDGYEKYAEFLLENLEPVISQKVDELVLFK